MTARASIDAIREAIAPWRDGARGLLLGLDFDGTLVPIMARPEIVELADSTRAVLSELVRSDRLEIMVVSGRARDDVEKRVGVPGLITAGNHGLEIAGPGIEHRHPGAVRAADRLDELVEGIRGTVGGIPGILVESKRLSASVHYRNVDPVDHARIESVTRAAVEGADRVFELMSGTLTWEIRPRIDWHKGSAIAWVRERLGMPPDTIVGHVGDDRTDEDAFETFPTGLTIKVSPRPEIVTAARFVLEDHLAVELFLRELLQVSRETGSA
ncbi:MAG: trehalose-phosphatase [Isosphaeraceae bacterium]|nr:trehalose-phosphatase [Isosphaeraceae bacterium]